MFCTELFKYFFGVLFIMVTKSLEVNQKWLIRSRNCYSNDLTKYNKILFSVCKKKDLEIKTLGKIDVEKMYFVFSKKINKQNRNILIVGGIHGDEPAGCWGILSFLENANIKLFKEVNLYIIPIFNPTGFILGNLDNKYGEKTNRGYDPNKNKQMLSKEGKIIVNANLEKYGFSSLITLHEDYDQKKYYVYSFENSTKPGKFSKQVSNLCEGIFEKYTGIADGFDSKEGLVFISKDYKIDYDKESYSFEHYFFKIGIKKVAATEVPRISNIKKRIFAYSKIIEDFVNLQK